MPEPDRFRRWYEQNRERRNAARREQYASDAGHRSALRERRREHYRSRFAAGLRPPGTTLLRVGDALAVTYRLSGVAAAIGRTSYAVERWVKSGKVPPPTLHSGSRGVYSAGQVELMRAYGAWIEQHGRRLTSPAVAAEHESVMADIRERWEEHGTQHQWYAGADPKAG